MPPPTLFQESRRVEPRQAASQNINAGTDTKDLTRKQIMPKQGANIEGRASPKDLTRTQAAEDAGPRNP